MNQTPITQASLDAWSQAYRLSDVRRIASSLIGALRWDDRIGRILDNAEDYAAFQARLDELDYALDTGAIPDGTLHTGFPPSCS